MVANSWTCGADADTAPPQSDTQGLRPVAYKLLLISVCVGAASFSYFKNRLIDANN